MLLKLVLKQIKGIKFLLEELLEKINLFYLMEEIILLFFYMEHIIIVYILLELVILIKEIISKNFILDILNYTLNLIKIKNLEKNGLKKKIY